MTTTPIRTAVCLVLLLLSHPVAAQTTNGTISGLITDSQGAALNGVVVRVRSTDTGLQRTVTSNRAGVYRLVALPVGSYEVVAEFPGFRPFRQASVAVNVARDVPLDIAMQVEGRAEALTVRAETALVPTRSSAVGELVDLGRIEGLPLNGRQFANLAATVPGVGLGFHSDLTKGLQYAPQIGGGNGRNINLLVDGGDNNDDTVGGQLQLFPLESIQEFLVLTQRFDAEYGRSSGGVINVVTKSGSNQRRGSWFTLMRDDGMNAKTFTEHLNEANKQPYERLQVGGSLGGPIVENRAHYFAAYELTNQDMTQVVNTFGLFPDQEGAFPVTFRAHLFTGKATVALGSDQYLSLRYGRDHNRQPSGVGPRIAHSAWATSTNSFDSINANHNWVIGPSLLNEAVVQYSDFVNDTVGNSAGPSIAFPNGVLGGIANTAPQRTEQIKWQLRNDVSWSTAAGIGLTHDVRAGVSWIHVPRLRVFAGSLTQGAYTMLENSLTGPVQDVTVMGSSLGNSPIANFPMEHYGLYVQDDWRISDRVTLNLGLRWDYVKGFVIDQSGSANFRAMQAAGESGMFDGTLLDDFGSTPRPDRDNVQPRIGAAVDLFGTGRDIVRGGWGIYTDFGHISANVLNPASDAAQVGIVFLAADQTGIKKDDGSFFRLGDSLDTIRSRNLIVGPAVTGEVASPLLEQPYTRQANVGWTHQIGGSTVVSADYVRADGRDLTMRVRPNVRLNPPLPQRWLAPIGVQPASNFRVALSKGSSQYDALILAFRRRLSRGVDASASYTLAKATSDLGTAYDEISQNLVQDIKDPFAKVQQAPAARTDSRHMISISAIVQAPFGVHVAPVFFYRSALPLFTMEGVDLNNDGNNNDRTPLRYRFTGVGDGNQPPFAEDGPCDTVICSRRAGFSQLNLRVSRAFPLARGIRIEAIGEVFNLFNATNPVLPLTYLRLTGTPAVPNAGFMMPMAFAGDVGQTEQRIGQVGFRLTF